jgi:hypothetical protein
MLNCSSLCFCLYCYFLLFSDLGVGNNLQSERISVPAGGPVDLPCRLPPTADLTWSREGGSALPPNAQAIRNILRLERVGERDSGRYICTSQGRTQFVDLNVERKLFTIFCIILYCEYSAGRAIGADFDFSKKVLNLHKLLCPF